MGRDLQSFARHDLESLKMYTLFDQPIHEDYALFKAL